MLQQSKYFQHSSFPSEEPADDRRTNIVVGMYKFHQTQGGNQPLAARVPGALPATSCRWWASCLAPHLVDKWAAGSSPASLGQKTLSMKNSAFLNFSPIVNIPDWISTSDFQLRSNCECLDAVTPSSMHACSSVETGTNCHIQFTDTHRYSFQPKYLDSFGKKRRKKMYVPKFGLLPISTCHSPQFLCSSWRLVFFNKQKFISGLFMNKPLDFKLLVFVKFQKMSSS